MRDRAPLPATEQSHSHRRALHFLPLFLLFAYALASALFAWNIGYEYRWTSDTTDTFYRIINSSLPQSVQQGHGLLTVLLSGLADVIDHQYVATWYQGMFDAYLRSFQLSLGDISLAYKILVFPFNLIFGSIAYFFFYWLTRNRGLACVLAILALLPMALPWAGERSGLGPIWTYTRRYFLTAWLPLIAFLYFRGVLGDRKLLILAIVGAGAASNLHASGIILLEVLVLTWVLAGPICLKRLLHGGGLLVIGLLFSVTAIGSLWNAGLHAISKILLATFSSDAVAASLTILDSAKEAISPELQYLFYPPRIYSEVPRSLVDIWLVATFVASAVPLVRRACRLEAGASYLFIAASACLLFVSFEQMWAWVVVASLLYVMGREGDRRPTFTLTAYLIISNFWVAVGGMLIFQVGYGLIDGFPLVFNQLRGIRFMGFWVFIWLAVLAVPVVARPLQDKTQSRLLAVAVGIAFLVTGQTVYRQYFRGQNNDRLGQKKALLELAKWAKHNTPQDSIFLVGYSSFGVLADRQITHTDKRVRNDAINWLPPKGLVKPDEALKLAQQFSATHVFLNPDQVPSQLISCIKTSNEYYAVAETPCLEARLTPSALRAPANQLLP